MPIQILFCCWMRLYQNGLQLPVKQDTPYIDTKRRVCIAVRVSGGADENGNDLDVSSKQRASVSFRCLLFPYTRCEALALKWSERADKEFLFLCCPHLSILIGKLINICTSGCQLLTVKFCYKAHFINTKDALSTILLNKHLQMRSSSIIGYIYHWFVPFYKIRENDCLCNASKFVCSANDLVHCAPNLLKISLLALVLLFVSLGVRSLASWIHKA